MDQGDLDFIVDQFWKENPDLRERYEEMMIELMAANPEDINLIHDRMRPFVEELTEKLEIRMLGNRPEILH